ncbi:MAG: hypothetical protein HOJ57_41375 [Lentisphaerae bacterium]|nr:hypothetical protein [Lentisphaerota bacterium]
MAIDERGGFCLYPEQRLAFSAGPSVLTAVPGDTSQPGWTATLAAQPGKRVALAVFPPKSFPWEQSFKTRLIHSNHYPASDDIRAWSRHGNVLILHQNIYTPGQSSGPYVIKDEIEFRRVIATAHEAGMQVLAYFNPGAYRVRDADKAFELLRGLRAEYGFDSFYFDGLYRGDDWSKSYVFIRRIRELVGDKAIYTHSTLNPPAGQPSPYCPFIDAYSDFLLRGEGQTIKSVDGPYLRYVIGTYNISNSIATLKGDKMEGVSPQEKLAAMLRLHGRARWAYPGLRVERDKLFVDWYFPTLDRMAAEHAAGMAAP